MIPMLAILRIRRAAGPDREKAWALSLPIPLFLIWLLLAPLVLVLLPLAICCCLIMRINPWQAISSLWGVLYALRGVWLEVDNPRGFLGVRVL